MDKEKAIEEMVSHMPIMYTAQGRKVGYDRGVRVNIARTLIEEYDYGNIRQALTEFTEMLKNIVCVLSIGTESGPDLLVRTSELSKIIGETLKEFLNKWIV